MYSFCNLKDLQKLFGMILIKMSSVAYNLFILRIYRNV